LFECGQQCNHSLCRHCTLKSLLLSGSFDSRKFLSLLTTLPILCLQRLLVPPDDISSSYFYLSCAQYVVDSSGNSVCLFYTQTLMDVLKITPPFFYSYQCGSTLLTSYIPVHMYSVSLQILAIVGVFGFIISSATTESPSWLMNILPGVCWPHSYWINAGSHTLEKKSFRLINPHQIISLTMNSTVLLLSFGLCSPVLCCYISMNICVRLSCWLMLIGRFVYLRIEALAVSQTSSLPGDAGSLPLDPSPS
jgi:hypothetical protein